MTWWLGVRSPVEATFLTGVFSPLTSAEACDKSSRWLWKEKYWCEKARKHICVTDRHDMTSAVKVALNPIQPTNHRKTTEINGPYPVKMGFYESAESIEACHLAHFELSRNCLLSGFFPISKDQSISRLLDKKRFCGSITEWRLVWFDSWRRCINPFPNDEF